MFCALIRRFARRVKWKPKENQASNANQWRNGLSLRSHPSAKRLAAGKNRQAWSKSRSLGHRGTNGSVGDLGRVCSTRTPFHVRKLIAERADASLRKPLGNRRHEWMCHARPCPMCQYITGMSAGRCLKQSGNVSNLINPDGYVDFILFE